METETFKYQVCIGNEIVLETEDRVEAFYTFNALPSGVGQPASKRRSLTRIKILLEDE